LASEINLLFIPNYPSGLYQKNQITCNLSEENRRFKSILYKKRSFSPEKSCPQRGMKSKKEKKIFFSDSNNWSVLFVN
jgi:hypothetical protein